MRRMTAIAALVAVGGACGTSEPVGHRTERLPGGGQRVINTGAPGWSEETAWGLEPDLVLGRSEGAGPDVFGFVGSFRVAADGTIYVLDNLAQEVRAFDASGGFLRTMGRKGGGPGELTGADALYLAADGRVLLPDLRLARYSVFGPDGGFLTSRPRRVRGSTPLGGFLPGGAFVDWGTAFPDEGPNVVAGPTLVMQPFRFAPDFGARDSLPPLVFVTEMTADGTRPQLFFSGRPIAYQDAAGGVWFANTREYVISRRDLDGDTTLVFSLPATPAPVTDADRAMIRERFASRPEAAAGYLEGLPATKPVLRGLFGDGHVHVYAVPELAGVSAGTAVDVFTETGIYLGRLDLPVPMRVSGSGPRAAATREHLYYLVADELDVPRIARLRIVRPG